MDIDANENYAIEHRSGKDKKGREAEGQVGGNLQANKLFDRCQACMGKRNINFAWTAGWANANITGTNTKDFLIGPIGYFHCSSLF